MLQRFLSTVTWLCKWCVPRVERNFMTESMQGAKLMAGWREGGREDTGGQGEIGGRLTASQQCHQVMSPSTDSSTVRAEPPAPATFRTSSVSEHYCAADRALNA